MGLDMYLEARTQNGDTEEIGYWRKANQIRAFFASYRPEEINENIEV